MTSAPPNPPKLKGPQVPQADSMALLLQIVESFAKGIEPTPDLFKIDQRQIEYYRRAAELLGLLESDHSKEDSKYRPTPVGRVLLDLVPEQREARLAIAFERSECAQAWAAFCKKSTVLEVEPSTAETFLQEATEVTGKTVTRRVTTLKKWMQWLHIHPSRCKEPPPAPPQRQRVALAPRSVFDRAQSAQVIRALAPGTVRVRATTAYLSVLGYQILCERLEEAHLQLLIGGEATQDSISAILEEFRKSIEMGLPDADKRKATEDLHRRVLSGLVKVRCLHPKLKQRLHAKVYIFDEDAAYITSANLSRNGFSFNIEAGHTVGDRESVLHYIDRFEHHFASAEDIIAKVLEIIEQSWVFQRLVPPYLLYLRVMIELFPKPPDLSKGVGSPLARYQQAICAAVLVTLRERRRALLVSPTGTGKTYMASYMAAVLLQDTVKRVVVLCPNNRLKAYWERVLREYQVPNMILTHGLLQKKGKRTPQAEQRLQDRLESVGPQDLVIVDECHVFRNDETNGNKSLAALFQGRENRGSPLVLLLTATPMSKGLEDLNTLLEFVGDKEIKVVEEITSARRIVNMTLPFILTHFATATSDGQPGLAFGDAVRFFPRIKVRKREYRSVMDDVFSIIEAMPLRFGKRAELKQLKQMNLFDEDLGE